MVATAQEVQSLDTCLLRPGNTNCGGCGMSTGLTMLGRALDAAGDTCTLVIPACCGIITAGRFPTTSYGVPTIATTFASAAAVASGVASIRDLNGEPGQVICWAGDGGTYDIGFATVSAAAERNENIIYICYDNEIYGNTGGQRSSATPAGARTATTPRASAPQGRWSATASSASSWALSATARTHSCRRAPRRASCCRSAIPPPNCWLATSPTSKRSHLRNSFHCQSTCQMPTLTYAPIAARLPSWPCRWRRTWPPRGLPAG